MKYISFDIETFDLEPHPNNVISFAMVVADTDVNENPKNLPHIHVLLGGKPYSTSNVALMMNSWLFAARAIAEGSKPDYLRRLIPEESLDKATNAKFTHFVKDSLNSDEAVKIFTDFVTEHFGSKRPSLAGKNVASFDYQFLPKPLKSLFAHRMLDPGSRLLKKEDEKIPDQAECCRRVGIDDTVTHDALGDARQVVEIFNRIFHSDDKAE